MDFLDYRINQMSIMKKELILLSHIIHHIAYNYINSYAIILGKSGNKIKGEALLKNAMIRAKSKLGEDSPEYFSTLFNYAEYLREFKIDNNKALEYYKTLS